MPLLYHCPDCGKDFSVASDDFLTPTNVCPECYQKAEDDLNSATIDDDTIVLDEDGKVELILEDEL